VCYLWGFVIDILNFVYHALQRVGTYSFTIMTGLGDQQKGFS